MPGAVYPVLVAVLPRAALASARVRAEQASILPAAAADVDLVGAAFGALVGADWAAFVGAAFGAPGLPETASVGAGAAPGPLLPWVPGAAPELQAVSSSPTTIKDAPVIRAGFAGLPPDHNRCVHVSREQAQSTAFCLARPGHSPASGRGNQTSASSRRLGVTAGPDLRVPRNLTTATRLAQAETASLVGLEIGACQSAIDKMLFIRQQSASRPGARAW